MTFIRPLGVVGVPVPQMRALVFSGRLSGPRPDTKRFLGPMDPHDDDHAEDSRTEASQWECPCNGTGQLLVSRPVLGGFPLFVDCGCAFSRANDVANDALPFDR